MKALPYALVVGSLMHRMLWIRPDICFAIGIMRNYILLYLFDKLLSLGYTNLDFKFGKDSCKCTFRLVFTLGNGVVS
ncbi:hypothetical protein AAG906_017487 [Vitis piasezkii]